MNGSAVVRKPSNLPAMARVWHPQIMEELRLDEVIEGDEQPATRGDLRRAETRLRGEFHRNGIDLRREMAALKQELLDHFDAAVENIVESLRGANADELSLLRDLAKNHDSRLKAVEQKAGLR